MSDTPDWYDESKVVKATYADGYSGWVVDLGDGTCRFSNPPLLGEGGPKWGDRVDLFYNPRDPFERPRVGYRIYAEGEEPVGRQIGLKREPDEEELAEFKRLEKIREKQECDRISANFDSMFGRLGALRSRMQAGTWLLRYYELLDFCKEQGIEVPEDLHKKLDYDDMPQSVDENEDDVVECRRQDLKAMMLAVLESRFSDVKVDQEEVKTLVERYNERSETARILTEKLAEQLKEEEEEQDVGDLA